MRGPHPGRSLARRVRRPVRALSLHRRRRRAGQHRSRHAGPRIRGRHGPRGTPRLGHLLHPGRAGASGVARGDGGYRFGAHRLHPGRSGAANRRRRGRGSRCVGADQDPGSCRGLGSVSPRCTGAAVRLEPDGRSSLGVRRRILRHALFGVDRNAAAVRLTELRLWLSVIADDPADRPALVRPLPNLDCLIRQGDTLFDAVGVGYRPPTDRGQIQELASVRRRVVTASGGTKRLALGELLRLEAKIAAESLAAAEAGLRTSIRECLDGARGVDLFGERRGLDTASAEHAGRAPKGTPRRQGSPPRLGARARGAVVRLSGALRRRVRGRRVRSRGGQPALAPLGEGARGSSAPADGPLSLVAHSRCRLRQPSGPGRRVSGAIARAHHTRRRSRDAGPGEDRLRRLRCGGAPWHRGRHDHRIGCRSHPVGARVVRGDRISARTGRPKSGAHRPGTG